MQRRHALILLGVSCGGLLLVLMGEKTAIPLYRFPMGASSDFVWLSNDRLLEQISPTEVRAIDLQSEKRVTKLSDDFPALAGLSASPDGSYIAWRDRNWTYFIRADDLARPVLPKREENDWVPVSNTHWLSDRQFMTFFDRSEGVIAAIADRDSDRQTRIQLPLDQRMNPGRGLRIIGETADHAIAYIRSSHFPIKRGKLTIQLLHVTGAASSFEAEIPLSGEVEDSEQVALGSAGDSMVWVVRRGTKPTWTSRSLARVSGERIAQQEYVLCTTALNGSSARIIARFPLYGQYGDCGYIRVSPDGKLTALRIGGELCIYRL